jgi:hypothetical protein
LLIAWLQELKAPLAVCNEILLQAGYAPAYTATQLDDPMLAQVNFALQQLIDAHDPLPALVIDAQWNLLRLNRGGQWLIDVLTPEAADRSQTEPINLLDFLIHPEGLSKSIVNLQEVGPVFLANLRHEASAQPELSPKADAFAALLDIRLDKQRSQTNGAIAPAPILTTRYATKHGELAFFSMFTTFGTPQDITLASLRVEHMFAADAETQAVVKEQFR